RDSAVGVCDSLVINLPRFSRHPLRIPPILRLLLEGLHVVAEAPTVVPQCRQHAAGLLLVLLRSTALSVGDIAYHLGHRVPLERVLVDVTNEPQRPVVQQRVIQCLKSRNHGFNHDTASLPRFVSIRISSSILNRRSASAIISRTCAGGSVGRSSASAIMYHRS